MNENIFLYHFVTIPKGKNNEGYCFFFLYKNLNETKHSFYISILVVMVSSHIDLYKEHTDTGKFIKNQYVTYSPIISDNNFILNKSDIDLIKNYS